MRRCEWEWATAGDTCRCRSTEGGFWEEERVLGGDGEDAEVEEDADGRFVR
jgi:hypothetical protein